jgi:D-lyxose ketol-isomerase
MAFIARYLRLCSRALFKWRRIVKRSEINAILREADVMLASKCFLLPPFAHWTPDDWRTKGPEAREIVEHRLGWDITDFGLGDYRRCGLLLFTLRNGSPQNLAALRGKLYAEKVMLVSVDQVAPLHFHWSKTEDIINRGGGKLMLQLYNATRDEQLDDSDVTVSVDGVERVVSAGGSVTLNPGESITLTDHLYHRFWAVGDRVLAGEVSLVNDDQADNRFYETLARFPTVVEDEPPLYLLCSDYPRYYQPRS